MTVFSIDGATPRRVAASPRRRLPAKTTAEFADGIEVALRSAKEKSRAASYSPFFAGFAVVRS